MAEEDITSYDPSRTGIESSLTQYAGPYVTEMLGKGKALADMPYEAYEGPLTAGPSELQTKAFEGIGSLNIPTEGMGAFTPDTFTAEQATQFMNPYLAAALAPQLAEARRQSDISALADASRLTKAGAFGGGRQAIMSAERDRNLQQNLAAITGKGYADAYDRAMGQFNVEQDRAKSAQEELNKYGLGSIARIADLGAIQRDVEQKGITADRLQFEEERDFPFKQVQYMQSLLQGLPLETQEFTYTQPTVFQKAAGGAGDIMTLLSDIFGDGDKSKDDR
tara:strand:+ start:633 stop:1469 length:837 start_codon:yes stop_codon:yes gene_type:complete